MSFGQDTILPLDTKYQSTGCFTAKSQESSGLDPVWRELAPAFSISVQDYLCHSGIVSAVGDPDDQKMFTRRNGRDVKTELLRGGIENAGHGPHWLPGSRVERPFGAAQRGRAVLRIEADIDA